LPKQYKIYLFDLDGTLSDPQVGIINSILYALARFGITEGDRKGLVKFIGPPLLESFCKYYGFSESEGRKAVAVFREYYAEQGIYENKIYDGVDDILSELHSRGFMLILATSKATIYAQRILDHFGIARYFNRVVGSNFDLTRAAKSEIIADILGDATRLAKRDFVMIGDHVDDIRGARENGIDSVAVAYGYGSEEDLIDAGPTYIVHAVRELRTLLLKKRYGVGP
jgi:phosphoglycolate phosphatase